jgi:hypothetical protein
MFKKEHVFFILILLVIVITVWYLVFQKNQYHSNVSELYNNFTDYMKTNVNLYLATIDCEPKQYSITEKTVCFPCSDLEACFNYAWVDTEGRKMNLMEAYLIGNANTQTKINFYSKGITSKLNCTCDKECICLEDVRVYLSDRDAEGKEVTPIVIYEYKGEDMIGKIQEISDIVNGGNCTSIDNKISCENMKVLTTLSKDVFLIG